MAFGDVWGEIPKGRLALVGVIVAFLAGSPAYRQVFGGRNPALRPWVMFSGYGTEYCQVAFHRRGADGDERVDRLAVLGQDAVWDAPRDVRRLKSEKEVRRQARQLCKALAPGTDLRADARCATRQGWRSVMAREEDLCRRPR